MELRHRYSNANVIAGIDRPPPGKRCWSWAHQNLLLCGIVRKHESDTIYNLAAIL